jgi:hypothetical protein
MPSFVTNDQDHQTATKFMHSSAAIPGAHYEWVSRYAKDLWDHRLKIFTSLDDKSDGIIKYLGGGTGLFALGVLAKVDSGNVYLVLWTLPALICALMSLFLAIKARKPQLVSSLPSVQKAMTYADENPNEDEALAAFLGQWNLACEHMRLICLRKAFLIEVSTWFYSLALGLLLLPLIVAAFCPPLAK